jgi:hypothetical protein
MRLLTLLALFMLTTTVVQFYSTDSHALTNKTAHQEQLSKINTLPEKQGEIDIGPPLKTKKVRVVEGNRNSQGMRLLSVLLLFKDKNK